MSDISIHEAKSALDSVIKKSRIHLYKPIQIAEILYRDRVYGDINLLDLNTYRNESKHWRDDISQVLLGRICTSSARFQDDLFNDNAVPPKILNVLGEENRMTGGAIEAYIYAKFLARSLQLFNALNYCDVADKTNFYVSEFIDSFWKEAGLKRSLDKIYEIIVYALFSTITEALNLQVEAYVNSDKLDIMFEFDDFARKIMCLDANNHSHAQNAKLYRVGVTNAADRGLDMYSNWGLAIQIKHLSLDEDLAQSITQGVSSDKIIIVCKDAEKNVIVSLLSQIGWRNRIQDIVTEQDLINWYEKALRGKFSDIMGDRVLENLRSEIAEEFPRVSGLPEVLKQRKYELILNK